MSSSTRRRSFTVLLGIGVLALLSIPLVTKALQPPAIAAAWQRARETGSYHFDSDVVQLTVPVASVTNVGQKAREERLRLEGSTNLRDQSMELKLWSRGGSVLQDETGVAIRVADGKTFTRQGSDPWTESEDITSTVAPKGDFLAYLLAVRDVKTHTPETRAGITFTRHSFNIDGPTFAQFMREQIEAGMRAEGSLPPGATIDVPRYYLDMTGEGELWVTSTGLPLRQILHLQFPEYKGERVSANITVTFSQFGQPSAGLFGIVRMIKDFATNPVPLLTTVIWIGFALLLIRFRRARGFQLALPLVVIVALIFSPLLTGWSTNAFFVAQTAKAAEHDEQQQSSNMEQSLKAMQEQERHDPHVDPMAAVEEQQDMLTAGVLEQGSLSSIASTTAETPNDGKDSDKDGLTDWTEVQLGTDPASDDTDADVLLDGQEINGFLYPAAPDVESKMWYLNANERDSNEDGIADTQEYDANVDNVPDDTDGDKIPNVFDYDNDDDGVSDKFDLAPFMHSRMGAGANQYYNEDQGLELKIDHLQANKPTFVDFQIRPKEETRLWYAFNVLDWPEDRQAQLQDSDESTFRDIAPSGSQREPSDAWGDMKLLPMLEMRMKNTSVSPSNLPTQEALKAYSITVLDYNKEGTEKVAYVPLSVVSDPETGARVAFNGRMLYNPSKNWGDPHTIRMVWTVQMLVDVCKDSKNGECVGYEQMNVPQVVQSYYDEWSLTGLNVREDHGAKVTIVHENPAKDTIATAATVPEADTTGAGLKDDRNMWALANGLDNSFLSARDDDGNGLRDVRLNNSFTASEIMKRFGAGEITDVTDPKRWGTPDVFAVDEYWYSTLSDAVADIAANKTAAILDRFDNYWSHTDSDPIMPLLLFAREDHYRGLGLDAAASGSYVSQSGNGITFDMQPTGQPSVTLDINAGLSWSAYCADSKSTEATWDTCDNVTYWDVLEKRHKAVAGTPGPGETVKDKQAEVDGEILAAQLYYLTLTQGLNTVVQQDTKILKPGPDVVTLSDAETMAETRKSVKFGRMAVVALVNQVLLAKYFEGVAVKRFLGHMFQKIKLGIIDTIDTVSNKVVRTVRDFFAKGKWKSPPVIAGVTAAIVVLSVGIGLLSTYYPAGASPSATAGKIILNIAVGSLIVFLAAAKPIMQTITAIKAMLQFHSLTTALKTVATSSSIVAGSARTAGVIGAVIAGLVNIAFFIWSVTSSGVDLFSPEFNNMLAETIAATIYLILVTALSMSVVGLILVGILSAVDAILTAICESGHDDLKKVEGLDGTCFTISGATIKAIAKLIYAYEPMIDLERQDLVTAGSIDVTLQDPNKGYVASNPMSVSMPITTTILHKDPTGEDVYSILPYLYYFSEDSLRSSTFGYSTTRNPTDINVAPDAMRGAWSTKQDHIYGDVAVGHWMYRGQARSTHAPATGLTAPTGINQSLDFHLNMGYAVPAYECWLVPLPFPPFVPPWPVCYTRTLDGKSSTKVDALKFDIFPDTIDKFMETVDAGNGGQRLAWDSRFETLYDSDGDGLVSSAYAGIDVNDMTWDSDDDGLSDKFELERRAKGFNFSTSTCDTDNDDLTDAQEVQFGTHPYRPDSDNDGLTDGEEVYHQVYVDTSDGGCAPTKAWSGGWDVQTTFVTSTQAESTLTTHVSSDPTNRDPDGDGVGDLTEKQLADKGFHPTVWNENPLQVLVETDDPDGIVKPGQSVNYITTVQRDDTAMGKGVLEVTKPQVLGTDLPLYKLDLDTQQSIETTTQLSVPSGAKTQNVTVTSSVRARLASSVPPGWSWNPNPGKVAGDTTTTRFMDVTASRPDRPDGYLFSAMTSSSSTPQGTGDIRVNAVGAANASRTLDQDNNNQDAKRGVAPASVACTDNGECLTVWDHYDLKASGGHQYDIVGAITGPEAQTLGFPYYGTQHSLTESTSSAQQDFAPVVATDGTDFLVAWERIEYLGKDADGFHVSQSSVVTRQVSRMGVPYVGVHEVVSNAQTFLTRDRTFGDRSMSELDVEWIGSHYRVARKLKKSLDIYIIDLNQNGSFITSAVAVNGNAFPNEAGGGLALAYNPVLNQTLLAYKDHQSLRTITGILFNGTATTASSSKTISHSGAWFPDVAYHVQTGGWLLSWHNQTNGTPYFRLLKADLTPLNSGLQDVRAVSFSPGANASAGVPLACPNPRSLPVMTLPFEELPGATQWQDSTPNGNHAVGGTSPALPAAGAAGAPDAPLSDYGVWFDGTDDFATLPRVIQDDFSIAFWIKTLQKAGNNIDWWQGMGVVDADVAGSKNDFGISLGGGNILFGVGSDNGSSKTIQSGNVADGDWHHVVATRSKADGKLSLYVDGASVATGLGSTNSLTDPSNIHLGSLFTKTNYFRGTLDHLSIYQSVMSPQAVQQLYSLRAFCVATAPGVAGQTTPENPYVELELKPNNTLGGPLDPKPMSLNLLIDADLPTADVSSFADHSYVQGLPSNAAQTVIIGGSASDKTSSIAKVEVTVNGGATKLANGAETWTYALTGTEGSHEIVAQATDAAGNIGNWSARRTLLIDATPPSISFNPGVTTVVPRRNTDGQWTVDLQGSVNDPSLSGKYPGSGVAANSVEVLLEAPGGAGLGNGWQTATLSGTTWKLTYLLPSLVKDAFGTFTVKVRAADNVGNLAIDASKTLKLDAVAPRAKLDKADSKRTVIAQPLTLTGIITETGSAGLDDVQLRYVPVEQVVAADNPMLQLSFDHRPNDVFYPDTSLQHNHARCATTSCPSHNAAGRIDQALSFNGTAIVQVPHDATIDFAQNESFTIGAWIKASPSTPTNTNARFINKRGGPGGWYALELRGGQQATLNMPNLILSGGPEDLRDDQWHHVMAVVDRSAAAKQARLYVDGKLVGERDYAGSVDNSGPLEIGGWGASTDQRFIGSIDQVTIFDRALLVEEVAALHGMADLVWQPATLGTPVATTDGSVAAWSVAVPQGLEGNYQIDLRGTDTVNNRHVTPQLWRGIIDTAAPRIIANAEPSGAEYFDEQAKKQRYKVKFTCAATDLHLDASQFDCPGSEGKPKVRSFAEDPSLETLFPDLTRRDGLSVTFSAWSDTNTPVGAIKACDVYGNCAETGMPAQGAVTGPSGNLAAQEPSMERMEQSTALAGNESSMTSTGSVTTAATDKPLAVVIDPTDGDVVASNGTLKVKVAAQAPTGASLSVVTLSLLTGNTWNEQWRSEPGTGIAMLQQEVELTSLAEGTYQVVAQAIDSNNNTSDTFPVEFTVDGGQPSVALTQQELTIGDTYQSGSGIMRLHGTASDSIGLATVQLQVGNGPWTDVSFENGQWHTAVPLGNDAEGKTFRFNVRAIDLAGQIATAASDLTVNVPPMEDLPDTLITKAPAFIHSSASATFEFEAQVGANAFAGFECRIDGGEFMACVSPRTFSNLAEGEHHFEVRAVDVKGFHDMEPAGSEWNVDIAAPETSIVQKPSALTNVSLAEFQFEGTDGNGSGVAGFECKLDTGEWSTCGLAYNFLVSDGAHTLEVRAYDEAGNKDATPATYQWRVDTTAPDTTITGQPDAIISANSVTLTFTGSDTGGSGVASFECSFDGGDWAACASPVTRNNLADGTYSFAVRSVDKAANVDGEPGAVSWTVDGAGPDTTITNKPNSPTPDRTATFAFTGDDGTGSGVAGFECKLDGGGWTACNGGEQTYADLAYGDHTFAVRAYDLVANRDQSPASVTWTVLNPTALNVEAVIGIYGEFVSLTAKLTSGTTGVAGKKISFTLNDTVVCGLSGLAACPTTDSNGVATLSNVQLGAIAAGSYISGVGASFTRDVLYDSSSSTGSLTVDKALLTATADAKTRSYGTSEPTFTVSYAGFKNGESESVLSGSPNCTTTATATSPVSPPTYPISCTIGTLQATNYRFSFVDGTLTITPMLLTITADNKIKQYSDRLPVFSVTYNGFQNGETETVLGGSLSCITTATATSPAGSYPITCSGQTATNYQLDYKPGTLTVTKEFVTPTYTGDMSVVTAGPKVTTAGVRLAVNLAQDADGDLGDITLAMVRFEIYKFTNNTDIPDDIVGNVPVDAKGNAVATTNLAAGDPWTIKIKIEGGNTYWTAQPIGIAVVNVALGTTEMRVNGGGWIADNGSTGKGNFGFTVSAQKTGAPKGNSVYVYRSADGYTYLIKSTSWQGGGLTFYSDPSKAAFSGKAVVQKIDSITGLVVESWGNYTYMVDLIDGDQRTPIQGDKYAITVLDNTGKVWRQVGMPTAPLELGGGSVTVKNK